MLGAMGAQDEAWELYRTETSPELRKALLQALFIGGAADKIAELARTEKDPDLRREAIRTLGLLGRERTGATLVSLYGSETDGQVKRAVLQGLFVQGNAEALVDIARKEKDRDLRNEAVAHLSHMNSKVGTDFMLEILNK
jgi:HEAT repeat protein